MQAITKIAPQSGPQEMFLTSPADLVIYGGAAGGGKTLGLLLECLRHINNPKSRTVIFRRTTPQITNPGGLWDESTEFFSPLNARSNQTKRSWTFESGAEVRFSHMQHEHNRLDWQGAQISLIGFDELTHFTEKQFWYLFSRSRSVSGIRPYTRATTNPDADSWVAGLVEWWIDQETGYAIPGRSGAIRWLWRKDGVIHWRDTAEELYTDFPEIGEIARVEKLRPRDLVKSVAFIAADLSDNAILRALDPAYMANLLALPLVEQERLLKGNWKIVPAGGKVFNRGWFEIVDGLDLTGGRECRFWDFAATEKKTKGDNPAFTAGVKIRLIGDTFFVMDSIAVRAEPPAVDRMMREIAEDDAHKAHNAGVSHMLRWEQEGGASGKRDSSRLVAMFKGYDVKGIPSSGDKLTRAKGLAAQAFVGNVKLIRGRWNDEWLQHMHHQPDWPYKDIMDASAGAFNELSKPATVWGRSPVADYRGS